MCNICLNQSTMTRFSYISGIEISDVLKIDDKDYSITFSLYFNVQWSEPRLNLSTEFFDTENVTGEEQLVPGRTSADFLQKVFPKVCVEKKLLRRQICCKLRQNFTFVMQQQHLIKVAFTLVRRYMQYASLFRYIINCFSPLKRNN